MHYLKINLLSLKAFLDIGLQICFIAYRFLFILPVYVTMWHTGYNSYWPEYHGTLFGGELNKYRAAGKESRCGIRGCCRGSKMKYNVKNVAVTIVAWNLCVCGWLQV